MDFALEIDMVQVLGFVASGLIVLSLTRRSILLLRVIGLIGALTFVGYGLLLGAWPVVATNLTTTTIHLFHLRSLGKTVAPQHVAELNELVVTAPRPTRPPEPDVVYAAIGEHHAGRPPILLRGGSPPPTAWPPPRPANRARD